MIRSFGNENGIEDDQYGYNQQRSHAAHSPDEGPIEIILFLFLIPGIPVFFHHILFPRVISIFYHTLSDVNILSI